MCALFFSLGYGQIFGLAIFIIYHFVLACLLQLFTRNQHQMDVHTSAYDLPFSRYTKSLSLRSQQLIFVRPVTDLEYSHESTSYNEFLELASACSHEIDQLFHKLDTKWEYLQAVVKTCA